MVVVVVVVGAGDRKEKLVPINSLKVEVRAPREEGVGLGACDAEMFLLEFFIA